MKRFALLALAVVLLAAGVLVYTTLFRLDGLVKSRIEHFGSQATGTAVRVSDVDLDLRAGRGTIRGLTVANPPGFSDAPAFSLAEITIELDAAAAASSARGASPIAIEEIRVAGAAVRFELDAGGRANLDVLRRNLKAANGASGASAGEGGADPGAVPPRLRVERLTVSEGRIHLDASAVGRDPEEIRLGDFALRDLGGAQGATPSELGRDLTGALVSRTLRAVAGSNAKRALSELGGRLGGKLGEAIEKSLEAVP